MSGRGSTTAAPISPPARHGCGRPRRWSTPSTSCSSTKPARSRWPTSSPIARATDSLVLLGDPQQLDQPLQGTHPPGADRSALAHVLGDAATMPPTRGLFLEKTWRLHPDLCDFTSEVFYDDRLEPEAHLAGAADRGRGTPVDGTGPRRLDIATRRGGQRVAGGSGRGRRARHGDRRRGGDVDRRDGVEPTDGLERHPHRRAVQRAGRRDQTPAADGGPGRDRRQVPGPGGADQHLFDDDILSPSSRRAAWTSCTAAID